MVNISSRSGVPKPLKPATEAFLLALLATAGPRTLSLLLSLLRRRKSSTEVGQKFVETLRDGFSLYRFPAFCGILAGGSTLLQQPIYRALKRVILRFHSLSGRLATPQLIFLARFLSALVSAAVSFHLLNTPSNEPESLQLSSVRSAPNTGVVKDGTPFKGRPRSSTIPDGIPPLPVGIETLPIRAAQMHPLAGKTLDLTLFAFVRAVDALCHMSPIPQNPRLRQIRGIAHKYANPFLFITSCATIMHAFFYAPLRLPHNYRAWISRLACVDERLIHALRQIRFGNFIYGQETGMSALLGDMCDDYGLPTEWGNPAKTVPIPCELVHHGRGPNCEYHALYRLARGIIMAMGVYAPLQAVILLRRLSKPGAKAKEAIILAMIDAFRSSAFLGSFVALFYYGVCLARTRLGPKLLGKRVSPQMWDGGLCIMAGCWLCGWSVLMEVPKRRAELMLFVLPRSLAVWMPRRYDIENLWKEHVVFAVSAATVITAAQARPDNVRGFFGGVLSKVLTAK